MQTVSRMRWSFAFKMPNISEKKLLESRTLRPKCGDWDQNPNSQALTQFHQNLFLTPVIVFANFFSSFIETNPVVGRKPNPNYEVFPIKKKKKKKKPWYMVCSQSKPTFLIKEFAMSLSPINDLSLLKVIYFSGRSFGVPTWWNSRSMNPS